MYQYFLQSFVLKYQENIHQIHLPPFGDNLSDVTHQLGQDNPVVFFHQCLVSAHAKR
jgi:uncharacterized protein YvpB